MRRDLHARLLDRYGQRFRERNLRLRRERILNLDRLLDPLQKVPL